MNCWRTRFNASAHGNVKQKMPEEAGIFLKISLIIQPVQR